MGRAGKTKEGGGAGQYAAPGRMLSGLIFYRHSSLSFAKSMA